MHYIYLTILVAFSLSCTGSDFSSSTPQKSKSKQEPDGEIEVDEDENVVTKPDHDLDESDKDEEGADSDEETDDSEDDTDDDSDITIEEDETRSCILDANGNTVNEIRIHGENCINNNVDAGGADMDDYHVTISGDMLRDGWEFFSNKDQEITISYDLGTPGSTTQDVNMNVVDCLGEQKDNFVVSQGNGSQTLTARKGDRFNIVMTVTSGCYGRKDVYDMLKRKTEAFRMD